MGVSNSGFWNVHLPVACRNCTRTSFNAPVLVRIVRFLACGIRHCGSAKAAAPLYWKFALADSQIVLSIKHLLNLNHRSKVCIYSDQGHTCTMDLLCVFNHVEFCQNYFNQPKKCDNESPGPGLCICRALLLKFMLTRMTLAVCFLLTL